MTPKQTTFFIFVFTLMLIGLVVLTLNWKGNSFYIRPYQAVDAKVKKERERRQHEDVSRQPNAPGFSENEIKKSKGNRYSTY